MRALYFSITIVLALGLTEGEGRQNPDIQQLCRLEKRAFGTTQPVIDEVKCPGKSRCSQHSSGVTLKYNDSDYNVYMCEGPAKLCKVTNKNGTAVKCKKAVACEPDEECSLQPVNKTSWSKKWPSRRFHFCQKKDPQSVDVSEFLNLLANCSSDGECSEGESCSVEVAVGDVDKVTFCAANDTKTPENLTLQLLGKDILQQKRIRHKSGRKGGKPNKGEGEMNRRDKAGQKENKSEKNNKEEGKKTKGEGKKNKGQEKKNIREGKKNKGEGKKNKGEGQTNKHEKKNREGKKNKSEGKKNIREGKKNKGEGKKNIRLEKKNKGEGKKIKGEEKKNKDATYKIIN